MNKNLYNYKSECMQSFFNGITQFNEDAGIIDNTFITVSMSADDRVAEEGLFISICCRILIL